MPQVREGDERQAQPLYVLRRTTSPRTGVTKHSAPVACEFLTPSPQQSRGRGRRSGSPRPASGRGVGGEGGSARELTSSRRTLRLTLANPWRGRQRPSATAAPYFARRRRLANLAHECQLRPLVPEGRCRPRERVLAWPRASHHPSGRPLSAIIPGAALFLSRYPYEGQPRS